MAYRGMDIALTKFKFLQIIILSYVRRWQTLLFLINSLVHKTQHSFLCNHHRAFLGDPNKCKSFVLFDDSFWAIQRLAIVSYQSLTEQQLSINVISFKSHNGFSRIIGYAIDGQSLTFVLFL
jgi:hypothetical protein